MKSYCWISWPNPIPYFFSHSENHSHSNNTDNDDDDDDDDDNNVCLIMTMIYRVASEFVFLGFMKYKFSVYSWQ